MARRRTSAFLIVALAFVMGAGWFASAPPASASPEPTSIVAVGNVLPPEQQPPQDGTVRNIEREDWIAHTPLVILCVLLVLAVDAAFIGKIILDKAASRKNARPAASR